MPIFVVNSGQPCRRGRHGPAAVHELSLDEPLEVLGVRAEVERVEAVVAREGAVEVSRGEAGAPDGAGRLGDGANADGARALAATPRGRTVRDFWVSLRNERVRYAR